MELDVKDVLCGYQWKYWNLENVLIAMKIFRSLREENWTNEKCLSLERGIHGMKCGWMDKRWGGSINLNI